MRIIYIMIILFLVPNLTKAPPDNSILIPRGEPNNPYLALWEATCLIESSKRAHIINHREKAFGIVQIRSGKLKDYNRATGNNFTLEDCLDVKISYMIWIFFAKKYGHQDPERIAKRWNGTGPMTEIYWKKVKKHL